MRADTTSSTSSRSSANASDSDGSSPSRAVSTPPSKDALSDTDGPTGGPQPDALNGPLTRMKLESHDSSSSCTSNASQEQFTTADEQIVEALKSQKDRIFVLKLGEQMETLIRENA